MMLTLSKSSLVFVAHVLSNVAKEGGERLKTSRFFSILQIGTLRLFFFCILANGKREIVIRYSSVLAVRRKLRSLSLNVNFRLTMSANDAQIFLILQIQ